VEINVVVTVIGVAKFLKRLSIKVSDFGEVMRRIPNVELASYDIGNKTGAEILKRVDFSRDCLYALDESRALPPCESRNATMRRCSARSGNANCKSFHRSVGSRLVP
jgi:hypothetical protein